MVICKYGAWNRLQLFGLIWRVLCGQIEEAFCASPPPFSVSSAIKQSLRLSGCWLVHSACLVSHVGAMQVYKPHTLSGQCLVGHSFGLLPPPPTFHGQFPSREKKNCDFFVSFLICREHFSRVFSSVWRRSGAVHKLVREPVSFSPFYSFCVHSQHLLSYDYLPTVDILNPWNISPTFISCAQFHFPPSVFLGTWTSTLSRDGFCIYAHFKGRFYKHNCKIVARCSSGKKTLQKLFCFLWLFLFVGALSAQRTTPCLQPGQKNLLNTHGLRLFSMPWWQVTASKLWFQPRSFGRPLTTCNAVSLSLWPRNDLPTVYWCQSVVKGFEAPYW